MGIYKKLKQAWQLYKQIDIDALNRLSAKVDLGTVMQNVSKLDDAQLQGLMKMLSSGGGGKKKKPAPPVDGDFYDLAAMLTPEQRELQLKVRRFMETEVQPLVNDYWLRAEFPHELIAKMAALNICGVTYQGYGCPGLPFLMEGILAMEMARVDASIATFFGVQSGLAMGSIYMLGSEAQKQQWLPGMQQMKLIGAFGLTEPEVGSGAAGGLTTTAKRKGDS